MLSINNVSHEYNGNTVLDEVSFSIQRGQHIGLVGDNGSGKTTLLEIIAGLKEPTAGSVSRGDLDVGLLPQDLTQWMGHTVIEYIKEVTGVKQAEEEFEAASEALARDYNEDTSDAFANALARYEKFGSGDFEARVDRALKDADVAEVEQTRRLGALSGGQRTRIALAAILASPQDLIILDEPTNNLDSHGVETLESFVKASSAAFLFVSHDRKFLRNAANRIIELKPGLKGVTHYGLGYEEYTEARKINKDAAVARYKSADKEARRAADQAKKARGTAISAESGRGASDGDKLTANYRGARAASSLSRQANRAAATATTANERAKALKPIKDIALDFEIESTPGASLLTVKELVAKYPNSDFKTQPVSFSLEPGNVIVINGDNGTGKSTILRSLYDEAMIKSGEAIFGASAKSMYLGQEQQLPLPTKNAITNLLELCPGLDRSEAINLLIKFNFNIETIQTTPAAELSGGERAKVLIAAITVNQPNLLILDEPTNNLDITTIEALEKALAEFKGGILLVSHDRDFVEALTPSKEITLK